MVQNLPTVPSHRLSLVELAKQQKLYEPSSDDQDRPIVKAISIPKGELDHGPRGWRAIQSKLAYSYYPLAASPRTHTTFYLGTRMVSKGLTWERHDIEYMPRPLGYNEWGANILRNHSFSLKGLGEGSDYLCGAIYCSLGDYSISPALLRSLLEKWDPKTNTFLFSCGERTITLLDMYQMAGLPLDGDLYEEFIPPEHALDPSLCQFPDFLADLLSAHDHLAKNNGGHVTFQVWCDYFHNRRDYSVPFASLREVRLYVAAYIAVWLCYFVVIGGGAYVRAGVLVMASWIALGRRISLAPLALCSIYFSLRRISTHPVGPCYRIRGWPVHFIIGWMGVYLKNVFGKRAKVSKFPTPTLCPGRLSIVGTMFRIPHDFSPEKAHDFFEKHKNIVWYPSNFSDLASTCWLQKAFTISICRGMLPWRRSDYDDDLCIVEPYHADRVARQFKLDQQVPYTSLRSLYIIDDISVAYAHWWHLLRSNPKQTHYIPNKDFVGNSSVAWTNWWTIFIRPFTSILGQLRQGDLVVVKKLSAELQEEYLAAIEAREMPAVNHWRDILRGYHLDNNAPPPLLQQKRKNNPNDVAASSSSNPRPLISVTVSGTHLNARKEGTDILVDGSSEGPSPNATTSSGGEERPAIKRKIEFSLEESPCNLDELVDFIHELGDTGTDDNIIGSDLSFEDFDISEPSLNLPTPPTIIYLAAPSYRQVAIRSMLPAGDVVPQIAPVRAAWENLTIEDQSKQKSEFVTAAESRAESVEAFLKTSAEEMSSILEKQAEKKERVEALSAQLQEATAELLTTEERVKQLESDRSAKQAEAKKLHEDLLEANVKASEELEALKGKTSTLEDEAKSITISLKDWRSMSN
ncbi:hypothetical protein VPH35_049860 [Triticum aestivum]